jgi:DNA-3-methyladenine glycosylase II
MSKHIQAHLSKADPVMAALIGAVGRYEPQADEEIHPFQALAQAIAHQQLNGTAANTILRRLTESCGQGSFPSPQCVLEASAESLRAAGFSFAKVAALKDLAAKTLTSVVPGHAELAALPDEEIIERLTQVRGIGRWTVEMLLMFRLGRPDVLPVDDFGVRAGFRAAYGMKTLPHPKALALYGERWKPYRSAAAWYLWRALELKRAGTLPQAAERIRLPRVKKRRRRAKAARAQRKVMKKRALVRRTARPRRAGLTKTPRPRARK